MSPHKGPNIIKYCVITSTVALVAIAFGVFTSNNRGISFLECKTISDMYSSLYELNDKLSSPEYKDNAFVKTELKTLKKNMDIAKRGYKNKGCNALGEL